MLRIPIFLPQILNFEFTFAFRLFKIDKFCFTANSMGYKRADATFKATPFSAWDSVNRDTSKTFNEELVRGSTQT